MIGNKKTDEGLDLLAKIVPHLETILHDEDYNRLKARMEINKNLTIADIMVDAYNAIAMKNRTALYEIVAAVTGKEPKEIAEQPLEETLAAFQGAMGRSVINFFIFCAHTAVRL